MAKVLVVDDDSFYRDFLTTLLGKEGHDVVAVESGEKALGLLRPSEGIPLRADLVTIDYAMANMDGKQLLQRIRAFDRRVPLLMITAKTAEVETLAKSEGAQCCSKAAPMQDLLAAIHKSLGSTEDMLESIRRQLGELPGPAAEPGPTAAPAPAAPARRKVMIVDDDSFYRAFVSSLLHDAGFASVEVDSGEKALALLKPADGSAPLRVDLVTIDYRMAQMGGGELAARIRSFDPLLPIVVVTGALEQAKKTLASVAGVRFIGKAAVVEKLGSMAHEAISSPPGPAAKPAASAASAAGAAAAAQAPAGAAKKVVVVDDDAFYRGFLSSLLKKEGHEVLSVDGGLKALELLKPDEKGARLRADLVTIDYNMDEMGGYELLRLIRTFDAQVPIIMISGTTADVRTLVQQEGIGYFAKGAPVGELLKGVRAHLGPPVDGVGADASAAEGEPGAPDIGPEAPSEEDLQDLVLLSSKAEAEADATQEQAHEQADEESTSHVVKLVNGILKQAVMRNASDVHIEPQLADVVVRLRIDGVLHQLMKVPALFKATIAARLKVMSSLNVTERRLPQDGRFSLAVGKTKVEFRLSTLPSQYGEKIVMRLLRQQRVKNKLSDVFLRPRDLELAETALRSPTGLILVTGPTGSGKTTTLYTMLDVLNKPTRNIITVEDPVEAEIPGITQVPVKAAIGYTFDKVLRACMRQDPNVIMLGEVRDLETAEMALKAAMTGHVVLSTLHTNTAAATIQRMTTMGLKPYMVAAALKLIVAQRLLRALCPHCKIKVEMTKEQEAQLKPPEAQRLRGELYGPKGCEQCGNVGFSGRRAVLEVMAVRTSAMRQRIVESQGPDAVQDLAREEGMKSLADSALDLVAAGETSLDEAFTVYYID